MGVRADHDDTFRAIKKAAEEQGWRVEETAKKRWKFIPKEAGVTPVFFPGTIGDWRAIRNFVSVLRRHGFRPPSKFGGKK